MNDEDVATVLECAQLAPSVHNTQPWTFAVIGDSIEVRADHDRGLAVLDPTSRELAISCGAAIELAGIAVRGLGWKCVTRVQPDADDSSLLAVLDVGIRRWPTDSDRELYDAIPRRYTDRGDYEPAELSAAELDVLRGGVSECGAWLKVLDRDGDRLAVIQALSHAEAAEASDPGYRAELADWIRTGPAPDGLPPAAIRRTTPDETVNDVPLRDFSGLNQHEQPGDTATAPAVERDLLLMIGTEADDQQSWVQAGRALGWLLLSLTSRGLSSQPLGQAIDLESTRWSLATQLGLIGHVQFLLRVGVGHGAPTTGRRRVSESSASTFEMPRGR
jgi:nitroreductase